MARGFWRGFVDNLPAELRGSKDVLHAVVTAMQIGMVMRMFWPGNPGLSDVEMSQCLPRLKWLEETFRPMIDV